MESSAAEASSSPPPAPPPSSKQGSHQQVASYHSTPAPNGRWPHTHFAVALSVPSPIKKNTKRASLLIPCFRRVARVHPFWLYVCYFLSLSFLGFLILNLLPSRVQPSAFDMFFTSVSAATASSMSTVEMESFADVQLLVMTVLMLVGGEVFTSIIDLRLVSSNIDHRKSDSEETAAGGDCSATDSMANQLELGLGSVMAKHAACTGAQPRVIGHRDSSITANGTIASETEQESDDAVNDSASRYLGRTVISYFAGVQLAGFLSVLAYLLAVPSAGDVLRGKHIRLSTFSIFTVVSTFSNCGFIPNNEGMVAFKNNPGLLLILCYLVTAGNTLFPPLLRLVLSALSRMRWSDRNSSTARLLAPGASSRYQYPPLLSSRQCRWLAATAGGFAAIQMALFCGMEWSKESGLGGIWGTYRKLVAALFMSLSSRHSGESVVDLSTVAPAILVLYIVMMYLPGHTVFLPTSSEEESQVATNKESGGANKGDSSLGYNQLRRGGRRSSLWHDLQLSHISYLALFTILICITERKSMSTDPLNFSFLNVVLEVVSAYGNVGFTTGYSCQRRLSSDPSCRSPSYGFVGAWSNQGKLILIVVMIFGRLKKLTMGGGRAWKLRL